MKFKVLFIMHMPPPVHGVAMMGKYLQESKLVNESFDCSCINLATADSLSDITLERFDQRMAEILSTLLG